MKFKVLKGTDTFQKLEELRIKVTDVNNQAKDVVKKLEGKRYCGRSHKLAGGISAIEFDTKPEGYKPVGGSWRSLYYPKSVNKTDCKLIESLPTVEYSELNDIIGFNAPQTVSSEKGILWISTIGLIFGENEMLIEVHDGCKYEAPVDVVEILNSEYFALKEAHEAKKATA